MHFARKVIGSLALLLLAGCTALGPDYREPSPEWLADWQPDLYGQYVEDPALADDELATWWKRFEDPVLDVLINEVIDANPGLRIAGLRRVQSA